MQYRDLVLPDDFPLSPETIAEIVNRLHARNRPLTVGAVRQWFVHGRLTGIKALKSADDGRPRDGKWSCTWATLVEALRSGAVPPRKGPAGKARPVVEEPPPARSAVVEQLLAELPLPLAAAARDLAAEAGITVEELFARALTLAAVQAGRLTELGTPRSASASR